MWGPPCTLSAVPRSRSFWEEFRFRARCREKMSSPSLLTVRVRHPVRCSGFSVAASATPPIFIGDVPPRYMKKKMANMWPRNARYFEGLWDLLRDYVGRKFEILRSFLVKKQGFGAESRSCMYYKGKLHCTLSVSRVAKNNLLHQPQHLHYKRRAAWSKLRAASGEEDHGAHSESATLSIRSVSGEPFPPQSCLIPLLDGDDLKRSPHHCQRCSGASPNNTIVNHGFVVVSGLWGCVCYQG